mmetsp:Transcript_63651/g.160664  ORF Transcript_63651/g.160664 Transcript_63651/m.160664 type:complete len:128 (+) Transcript_63651:113-496(+)
MGVIFKCECENYPTSHVRSNQHLAGKQKKASKMSSMKQDMCKRSIPVQKQPSGGMSRRPNLQLLLHLCRAYRDKLPLPCSGNVCGQRCAAKHQLQDVSSTRTGWQCHHKVLPEALDVKWQIGISILR